MSGEKFEARALLEAAGREYGAVAGFDLTDHERNQVPPQIPLLFGGRTPIELTGLNGQTLPRPPEEAA